MPRSWFHHPYRLSQILPTFPEVPARRRTCLPLSLQTCPSFTWGFPRASAMVRIAFEATWDGAVLFPIPDCRVPPNWPVVNTTSLYVLLKNQRIIDEFPLSHICPQFPICLSDSSITISLPRDDPSFLALPIIQNLHGAHTDTSFLYAAILRTLCYSLFLSITWPVILVK